MTMELKKPHPSRLVGGARMQNGLVPYPHVVDKHLGGVSWEWGAPAPHQAPSPGFQCQEDLVPITAGYKHQQGLIQWKKLLESQAVPLKEPPHGLTQIHSLWALCITRVAAWMVWVTYGEELKCLVSREELGDSYLSDRKLGRIHCPFLSPSLIKPQSLQDCTISETPSTWPTLFTPPWRSPEILPYPNC